MAMAWSTWLDVLRGGHQELPSIEATIEAEGGLVCEAHPHLEFPHGDCAGPGMTKAQAVRDGLRDA